MPISHVMVKPAASQHAAAVDFYTEALKPLGYSKLKSFPNGLTGFGNKSPDWWVAVNDKDTQSAFHVAFRAPDSAAVDAFYNAAIKAGAKDNGLPGLRVAMDPKYYAAFIIDPLGNNLEAGCMVD